MRPIQRSFLAEINLGSVVPGNGSVLEFQDFPKLRNVFIFGIEAVDATILATSPTQKTNVNVLTGLTLTLADKNQKNVIEGYPCYDLSPANIGGLYREFKPFPLNLVKSFIRINSNTGLNANESVCFNVFYCTYEEMAAYIKAQQSNRR